MPGDRLITVCDPAMLLVAGVLCRNNQEAIPSFGALHWLREQAHWQ